MGMRSAGWEDVPLVAMETVGADCFNQSLKAGRIIKTDAIRRSGDLQDSKVGWYHRA